MDGGNYNKRLSNHEKNNLIGHDFTIQIHYSL